MSEHVKIFFQLEPDEDGYPPAGTESLWAYATDVEGEYVIDNIPVFVGDATLGDTVSVRQEEGVRWFDKLVRRSGNSLMRVLLHDLAYLDPVRERLELLGCSTEHGSAYPHLLSVSIPPESQLSTVQDYLREEESAGHIGYEEPILRHE